MRGRETIFRPFDLAHDGGARSQARQMEHNDSDEVNIDRNTSFEICREVGERLQRDVPVEAKALPSELDHLMGELRKQDAG